MFHLYLYLKLSDNEYYSNVLIYTVSKFICLCLVTAWATSFLGFLPAVNNVPVNLSVVPGHQLLFTPCQVLHAMLVVYNRQANPGLPPDTSMCMVLAELVERE